MHALTDLHVSPWSQKDDPSSKLNNTPPIGAPKAAKNIQKSERKIFLLTLGLRSTCIAQKKSNISTSKKKTTTLERYYLGNCIYTCMYTCNSSCSSTRHKVSLISKEYNSYAH